MNRAAPPAGGKRSDKPDDIDQPFAGDLLQRTRLADRLTGYINRLENGAVIAIDALWGEGKTWFASNWAARLHREGYPVVFIDAFAENDELDPFFILAAELALLFEDGQGTGDAIRGEAARLMNAMMPLAGKPAAARAVPPAPPDAPFETTGDDMVNRIEKRLKAWPAEKALFARFRTTLGRIVSGCGKPAVIVIDELDRCRPSFAIRFLERIRHYFDMPNLIFVLPVNRIQLHEAVRNVYGTDTDAGTCLHRFIELMTAWAALVPLTLSEIERAVTLYILAGEPPEQGIATFLIVLKIKKPEWIAPLLKNDRKILVAILDDFLSKIITDSQKLPMAPDRYFIALQNFFNSEKSSHMQDRQVITQFQTDVLDPNSFYIESLEEISYLIRMVAGNLDLDIPA